MHTIPLGLDKMHYQILIFLYLNKLMTGERILIPLKAGNHWGVSLAG